MSAPDTIEGTRGTPIKWGNGCDPTKVTKTKRVNQKKVEVEEKVGSFFDIFDSLNLELKDENERESSRDQISSSDMQEKIDGDLELGLFIKNQVVPKALQLYLGVVELGMSDDEKEDFEGEEGRGGQKKRREKEMNPEDCKQ